MVVWRLLWCKPDININPTQPSKIANTTLTPALRFEYMHWRDIFTVIFPPIIPIPILPSLAWPDGPPRPFKRKQGQDIWKIQHLSQEYHSSIFSLFPCLSSQGHPPLIGSRRACFADWLTTFTLFSSVRRSPPPCLPMSRVWTFWIIYIPINQKHRYDRRVIDHTPSLLPKMGISCMKVFFSLSFLPVKSRTFFVLFLYLIIWSIWPSSCTVRMKGTAALLFANASHVPCMSAPQIKISILTPQITWELMTPKRKEGEKYERSKERKGVKKALQ